MVATRALNGKLELKPTTALVATYFTSGEIANDIVGQ
jgi:hypothetical protein